MLFLHHPYLVVFDLANLLESLAQNAMTRSGNKNK
jgi:hypothetical protein